MRKERAREKTQISRDELSVVQGVSPLGKGFPVDA